MKAFLGLIQFACGIGGLIALFNAQWVSMILAWGVAFLVGVVGSRMVRLTEGVSQAGQESIGQVNHALSMLRSGQFSSAIGSTRSAIVSFRAGGDRDLLPFTLLLQAVVLAANHDVSGAQKSLDEVSRLIRIPSPAIASEVLWMRECMVIVQREVSIGVPNPPEMVDAFLTLAGEK